MKKIPLFFLMLFALVSLSACAEKMLYEADYPEKTLNETVNIKNHKVTKIVFEDGRGRNHPFFLADQQKISEFIKMMDGVVIKKENSHEPSAGWTHSAYFYSGNKKLFHIVFNNPLQIDNDSYVVVSGQLEPKELDEFIKSADPDWKF
ncbi:hypothetical protein LRR81_08245 [Metabacillus sp. GX 13764]|uniref:hypothetical protein n=1 Tax=Metabacillus kandeliae TaxID=2900151 RepID=UPI001E4B9F3F|nr:hypothetical protein [Metabacillus kandeliae]MCD7034222.1 hypothetical protein [Metabacillus kandeliae]